MLVAVWMADQVPAPVVDPRIDQALRAIEKAGETDRAFSASVGYETRDALLGDGLLRLGRVICQRAKGQPLKLAVLFEYRKELGDDFEYLDRDAYIINGSQLIERDEDEKLIITHALDGPVDMQLGGRFPLPIGQKRDDVLSRFDVTLLDRGPEGPTAAGGTRQRRFGLHLEPKPDTPESEDWKSFDLWYDTVNWLPLEVEAVKANGDVKRIGLTDLKVQATLPPEDLAVFDPTPPGEGWVTRSGDSAAQPPRSR